MGATWTPGAAPFFEARVDGASVRTRGQEQIRLGTLMLHGVPSVYSPYLDPDVVAFRWAVPSRHVDGSFHDDVIAAHVPAANAIPYRPTTPPQPSRTFMREVNRGILRRNSDGSLVDRDALIRRAALGSVIGDRWFGEMRRAALTTYLVQLEPISSGRGPVALD